MVIVGGGPAGATAATDLASLGRKVALIDKSGRIKPCGGAIPPRLIRDFDIPQHLLKARVRVATMVSPRGASVDMPIDGGFVGMVDREEFDEWLRVRAGQSRAPPDFPADSRLSPAMRDGLPRVHFRPKAEPGPTLSLKARIVIGADGANSAVGRQEVPRRRSRALCFCLSRRSLETPRDPTTRMADARCEIHYRGALSPDFYAWIFPHGDTMSVGSGSAQKGFSLKTRGSVIARAHRSVGRLHDPPRGRADSG